MHVNIGMRMVDFFVVHSTAIEWHCQKTDTVCCCCICILAIYVFFYKKLGSSHSSQSFLIQREILSISVLNMNYQCVVAKTAADMFLDPGGHSAHTHTGGGVSPRNFHATQKYHFSFIATHKYQLILYLGTCR